jgi:transposase-like protein
MKEIKFTQEQIKGILTQIAVKEDGYNQVLKLAMEALMQGERMIYNEKEGDVSNGYRPRKTFGRGKILELRVPRTRQGNFYPLLLGLLKDQEEECRKIAFSLYGAGLTCEQVGEVFEELYGKHYSSSQVSRMFDYAREEVKQWLSRPLEEYYPIVFIDAVYISTRRVDHVSKEAYYTILGVKSDRSREVLALVNFPTESAMGWEEAFLSIKERGVKQIDLVVCDGLTGIEKAIAKHYSMANIQLCTVHLERNLQKYVKPKDKAALAQDFDEVFRRGDSRYNKQQAQEAWKQFCAKWGKYYPAIGKKEHEPRMNLYFTYLDYDYRIQSMIHTTNWIERLNRDYKRTVRMRGALPNSESVLLLLGHVAMTRKAYQRKIPLLNHESAKFNWSE